MNKMKESRTGLNNTGVVIAKCMNTDCGWEARIEDNAALDDVGNFYCPMCGKLMQGEIN
jgi:predicted RNA-binding Zn-ribbon protein involved in translation (DUF1610 family)